MSMPACNACGEPTTPSFLGNRRKFSRWNCERHSTNWARWWAPSTPMTCLSASLAASALGNRDKYNHENTKEESTKRVQIYFRPFVFRVFVILFTDRYIFALRGRD